MKVQVDRERCQGHGMCWMVAGEIFLADDEGLTYVESEEIEDAQEDAARSAAGICPESAISLDGA